MVRTPRKTHFVDLAIKSTPAGIHSSSDSDKSVRSALYGTISDSGAQEAIGDSFVESTYEPSGNYYSEFTV